MARKYRQKFTCGAWYDWPVKMKDKKQTKERRARKNDDEPAPRSVSSEAIRGAFAVLFVAVAGFLVIAESGGGGVVGNAVFNGLSWLLGVGYSLLPLSFFILAILIFRSVERHFGVVQIASMTVFLLSSLALVNIGFSGHGGVLGEAISRPLLSSIDTTATAFFLVAFILASLVISFDIHLGEVAAGLRNLFRREDLDEEGLRVEDTEEALSESEMPIEEAPEEYEEPIPAPAAAKEAKAAIPQEEGFPILATLDSQYVPPPISLLGKNRGKPEVGDVKANMNIIKRTLQNFGIHIEMDEATIGPTVTRYAMKPAEGVRLSKIVALQSNLELALAASPVRIEAPIPGKSLVGIEVPNIARTTLGLGPLIGEEGFSSSDKPLLMALGRSITGTANFADLAKMPHLLVAGATGSGKTCGKDTYIFSEKGILTFDELCPLPLNTETGYELKIATRDGIETTSKNYNNGVCDFYRIITEEGLSIDITAEHPLWVIRDGSQCWQNGSSIQKGEYVAISRGSRIFGSLDELDFVPSVNKTNKAREIQIPKKMTEQLGLFMGLLTADGGLTIGHRVVYTQANPEVLALYAGLLRDLFGINAPAIVKSGASNKAKDIVVNSKRLKEFLSYLDLRPVGAREKEIPRSVRESRESIVRAFIQGLIRNDGHVSSRGLEITLASEHLLKQLQVILLNFGIVSSLHPKIVKGYEMNTYWRLALYGANFATYCERIGFLTEKERTAAQKALMRTRNTNKNIIPTLAPLLKRISLAYRTAFARLTNSGWQYQMNALIPKYAFKSLRSYTAGDRNPSYDALGSMLTFYEPLQQTEDYRNLEQIRRDNFYWAKVADVKRTQGVGYDFEVPGSHSFVGNGFVNHNSVTIHDLVVSLLYRCGPERLRFIMVDPKRVELTLYNSIPHLLTPVITDAKKCILALKWLAKEMERRYNILETEAVRDISSYHQNVVAPALESAKGGSTSGGKASAGNPLPEAMPYIVLIIDELADIMSAFPRELEGGIVRLAQMSRAVGIHLILSTQRPSVKVITGLIKANIPARVALQVSSQIDSRTILDGGGAEKLLGAGDMLFLSGEMSKPRRIQAALISEEEVKRVVAHIARHAEGQLPDEIDFTESANRANDPIFASMQDEDEEDELYGEAKKTIIEAGKASTSYLQRKLGIGYARAARLMDILEERGVIGPPDGAKPRDVIGAVVADELAAEPAEDEETTSV
ncbi:hypothetical protein HY971_05085 [Candidatus Kaiserbacteria bacterium]|nr:hypothetical protein [Candidatus Kaiserbacteria bacterium]